jgi:uncharacterized protein YegP (UPF0339 family)
MKRPKVVIVKHVVLRVGAPPDRCSPHFPYRSLTCRANYHYAIVAKNGRTLAINDEGYSSRKDAIRGAKDLIKTCLIMFNERKVRIVDG